MKIESIAKPVLLSQLIGEISDTIGEAFSGNQYWIIAETSDIKNYPDRGYCFTTLVDKMGSEIIAKAEAVIWKRNYQTILDFEFITGRRFERNLRLLLNVEVVFHPVYGLRLEIIEIDPSFTLGQLELERQEILRRLVAENPTIIKLIDGDFITRNKTLARSLVIRTVALITAPDSDGQRDFIHELEHNSYGYQFKILQYLTQIQGKNADLSIIEKLEEIKESKAEIDAVVIVRGGGSQLDLNAFETYNIGKAIAGYPKLILTGIGHERNVSIADLMSHINLKTPTKAASFIIEHNRCFEEEILELQERIFTYVQDLITHSVYSLEQIHDKLVNGSRRLLEKRGVELENKAITIQHLNPENILTKGFAMVYRNGHIITDPKELHPGDEIMIRMQASTIISKIIKLDP